MALRASVESYKCNWIHKVNQWICVFHLWKSNYCFNPPKIHLRVSEENTKTHILRIHIIIHTALFFVWLRLISLFIAHSGLHLGDIWFYMRIYVKKTLRNPCHWHIMISSLGINIFISTRMLVKKYWKTP